MKIVVIEPLAVEEKRFLEIARAAVGQEHEIVCYDTRTTDVKELGERGKDADIIALGNLPFPREVLEQCENLKMLAVAFTGLDHVDLMLLAVQIQLEGIACQHERRHEQHDVKVAVGHVDDDA